MHAGGKNPGSIPECSPMTPPGILPSPLRDKVGYSNHDRFRGHIPVHCCSGLQPPCLRFAMAVTGHHARLGTRLLARLCRGRHSRRLGYMRFQGATRTDPYRRDSRIRLPPWVCDGEARWRPRVQDSRLRQPVIGEARDSLPMSYQPLLDCGAGARAARLRRQTPSL